MVLKSTWYIHISFGPNTNIDSQTDIILMMNVYPLVTAEEINRYLPTE